MKTYHNIQDFLEAHGYTAEAGAYHREEKDGLWTCIPPEAWQGLTVEAFIRKARINQWVPLDPEMSLREQVGEEEAQKIAQGALSNEVRPLVVGKGSESIREEETELPLLKAVAIHGPKFGNAFGTLFSRLKIPALTEPLPGCTVDQQQLFSDEGIGRNDTPIEGWSAFICSERPIDGTTVFINGEEVEVRDAPPPEGEEAARPWRVKGHQTIHLARKRSLLKLEEHGAEELAQKRAELLRQHPMYVIHATKEEVSHLKGIVKGQGEIPYVPLEKLVLTVDEEKQRHAPYCCDAMREAVEVHKIGKWCDVVFRCEHGEIVERLEIPVRHCPACGEKMGTI